MVVDLRWWHAIRAACEPVFAAADVGFRWNSGTAFDPDQPTLLWEADPARFAARYPGSHIEEEYGEQWPPPCIDYWIYVDPARMTARLSTEGSADPEKTVSLSGDGAVDGSALAAEFSALLRLRPPS